MNKSLLISIWSMLALLSARAQGEWSFENYHYLGQQTEAGIIPVMHWETKHNWYTEVRYNYEEKGTCSVFSGYSFRGGREWEWRVTPLGGFSAGRFNGLSAGLNAEIAKGRFYISSDNQYSVPVDKKGSAFVYSWSEVGIEILKHGLLGVSVQYFRDAESKSFAPGLLAGIRLKRITFPAYVFEPFSSSRYFVVGVNYELKK